METYRLTLVSGWKLIKKSYVVLTVGHFVIVSSDLIYSFFSMLFDVILVLHSAVMVLPCLWRKLWTQGKTDARFDIRFLFVLCSCFCRSADASVLNCDSFAVLLPRWPVIRMQNRVLIHLQVNEIAIQSSKTKNNQRKMPTATIHEELAKEKEQE